MATDNMPAEMDDGAQADTGDVGDENLPSTSMEEDASSINPVMTGFNRLSIVRQVGLILGFAAILALGVTIIVWSQETSYRPLVSNLEDYNAREILEALDGESIDYTINPSTGIVMVAEDEIHEARLALAPIIAHNEPGVGLELLDKEQGLGTSQFIESARYRRGLEGELARTIASMQAVRNARVHLALPKQSVFVRDDREPRASIFLEIYGGKGLNKDQADAIISLVASSIPELPMDNITLVDQKGNLLSRDDETEEDLMASKQFEYARKVEENLNHRLQRILDPILGSNNFQSEVAADVDFTIVEQTEELYNPDLIALRSEQTLDEESINKADGGIPGALTNQPPGVAEAPEEAAGAEGAPPAQPLERRSEKTRNYEVDRTLSHTQHQVGRVRRLTVSVAINDKEITNAETGTKELTPWTDAEIQRLELIVKDAVGFNASRGDSVSVVNSQFLGVPMELGEPDFWKQPWFWDIVKQVLAGLFLLIILFGVVRPIVRNLIEAGKEEEEEEEVGLDDLGDAEDLFGDDKVTLTGVDEFLLPGASEGFERQLDALKGLIAEDPGRVATAFKKWVNDGE